MNSNNICFRALDHKHERSDIKIIRNLESHFINGVLSRKERYGEFPGRVLSGMFRQPQDDIYIASPKDFPLKNRTLDFSSPNEIKLFLNWFDREHEAAHRAYLILSCPVALDRYKQRQHVIHGDMVVIEDRHIVGCILRSELLKQSTQERISRICAIYQSPILHI